MTGIVLKVVTILTHLIITLIIRATCTFCIIMLEMRKLWYRDGNWQKSQPISELRQPTQPTCEAWLAYSAVLLSAEGGEQDCMLRKAKKLRTEKIKVLSELRQKWIANHKKMERR